MENIGKMAATLPDYEGLTPMSDEEREVDVPLAPSQEVSSNPTAETTSTEPGPTTEATEADTPMQEIPPALTSQKLEEPIQVGSTESVRPSEEIVGSGVIPVGGHQGSTKGSKPGTRNSGSSGGLKSTGCPLCHKAHPLRRCRRFRGMSLEKKVRTLVSRHICSNCLCASHSFRECTSEQRCRECNEKHHTLLHPCLSREESKNLQHLRPSSGLSVSTRPPALPCPSVVRYNPVHTFSIQPMVTLGPTVVCNLVFGDRRYPVRALLDPCAGNSRICRSLVESMQLSPINVDQDQYCPLNLESFYSRSERLLVSARVSDLQHIITPSATASDTIKDHYGGMMLADPQFFRAGRIAMVLGPDVYPRIMKPQKYASPGFPWAQLTIFGWVVSGTCPM
ncbi:uncharacterized protein [Musca autumnalis]|uniref:uncharacterized protein n=1 Tax=Musca autumnalis TaxID=221902 RepID=UPI003CE6B379